MKRDLTLDIVKGIACLLMILAHPKTLHLTIDTDLTTFLWYVGFFAPVVFFASVGVSLRYQLNKRSKLQIVLSNLLLITFVYISQNFNFDSLFTALTLSTVMSAYLLRWNSAFLIIGIKIIDELLNYFTVSYRHLHGTLFSLIPWVAFIFLGDYLQKNKKMRLPVFILASASTLYLKSNGAAITGQSPTPIFMTVGIAIYSFVILVSPYLSKISNVSGSLVFLGKNTLLFWWVHFFLLKTIFTKLGRMYAPYTWVLLLFTSAVVILMLNKLNKLTFARISDKWAFWVACLAVYIITAFMPPSVALYFGNLVLFIFAMNYHKFLPALKRIGDWYTERKMYSRMVFRESGPHLPWVAEKR